jgi:hypothetical protein
MNEHELASRFFEMASLSDDDREHLGGMSRTIAAQLEPERFGEGLADAGTMAINLSRERLRQFDRALLFAVMRFRR